MNALKVKKNLIKTADVLSDAELGRLFRGMLKYAFSGVAPQFSGSEKILWPDIMEDIDRQQTGYQNKVNGVEKARSLISVRYLSDINQISDRYQSEKKEEDKGEENEKEAPSSPLNPPVTPKKELKEGETEGEKKPFVRARKQFVPPTLDEVRAYVAQRGSNVDPVQFFEYFQEGGWVDAKGQPVRAWKQKLLTWEKFNPGRRKTRAAQDLDSTYDMMRRWADE